MVAGNSVYSVDLAGATMTVRTSITGFPDGLTSLSDIDRDGDIDAVVVGQNAGGRGVVYVWDLQTTTQIGSTFQIDACSNAGGFVTPAGGLATLADLNNAGGPEIVVSGRNVLLALRFNSATNTLVEFWSFPSVDNSGRTGSTAFDFEGDGNLEIVHRDDATLRILNGQSGAVRFGTTCTSGSRFEAPVVADVDNNGQANIICHCNNSVKAFQPTIVPWVSARTIWNQRGYFVLNIRDNLRIPGEQQGQELGFPNSAPSNFPFNAFMKQTTRLSNDGTITYPAANDQVSILNPLLDLDLGPCQNGIRDSIGVRLTVRNTGNAPIPIGTPISFYNGDPYTLGSTFMQVYNLPQVVPAGAILTLPMVYVADQGGTVNLFFQINDQGTNSLPLTAPASTHLECNYLNNIGNIQITNCGNTPPVIDTSGLPTNTIVLSSPEDQPVTLCISASDAENNSYDVTGQIGAPTIGTLTGLSNGDSCVTLTPFLNSVGTTSFSLIICDNGNVSLCDTVLVNWTVYPANDKPVALDDAVTTTEDTPVNIAVLSNDTDIENDPLTASILSGPFHGTAIMVNDTIQYTPGLNYFGQDTIYYRICDNALPTACDTGMVIVTILPVNDPPLANSDTISLPNDTLQVIVAVTLNDVDPESDVLSVTITCGPTNGTATVNNNTLSIVYIPDSTFIGVDSICYVLCDNGSPAGCDTAIVYLNIFNGNEAPIAIDDIDSTLMGDSVTVALLPNDSDPNGHAFSVTQLSCGPNHGTVTLNNINGTVTYTPVVGYLGPDTICYVICDVPPAGPPFCDTAYVLINVNTSNIPPVAVMDTMTVPFNTTVSINIMANDSDANPQDSLFVTIIQMPANGTVLLSGGVATYTPNATFVGVDSFCYSLCDNGVPVYCDTACVTFTVQSPIEIEVPNGFSPNGDGANDFLNIGAIQLYPNNNFQVFTRWGTKVFEADGYNNDWDGTWNGNQVPDGTYFYRLDPGDGSSPLTGFFLIYR
ncbi:MAG: Ig-like domain-containing protein [Bacteroidia bacterium]